MNLRLDEMGVLGMITLDTLNITPEMLRLIPELTNSRAHGRR